MGALVDPELLPRELEEEEWQDLFAEWSRWLDCMATGHFAPVSDSVTGSLSFLGTGSQQASSVLNLVDTAFRSHQVRLK